MSLVRFEPWSLFDELQRDFNRSAMRRFGPGDGEHSAADWVPAVDIVEHKDHFIVRADVPGVDPADIDVSMDNGVLSVAGERRAEDRSEIDGVQRFERSVGRFYRRFTLPDSADAEGITARSTNGILEISIPKLPEVQARRIAVESA
ncbi:MAG: Hsp20/alpha crystallin family protein [Gammaproteobacteria bacterium]|nr:Hsp20/alpha crystallin family protein [Gammaproteobacteria bacterium]